MMTMRMVVDAPLDKKELLKLSKRINIMARSEGLYDSAKPSEDAKALGKVLDVLKAMREGIYLPIQPDKNSLKEP